MLAVLLQLREIELEVLARLDDKDGGEHVGSVRLVYHAGKRAMPIFEADTKPRRPNPETKGGEADEKMEVDALVTLAGLDIGRGGATSIGEDGQTWRTARWNERGSAMTLYTDASEMQSESRVIPAPLIVLQVSKKGYFHRHRHLLLWIQPEQHHPSPLPRLSSHLSQHPHSTPPPRRNMMTTSPSLP